MKTSMQFWCILINIETFSFDFHTQTCKLMVFLWWFVLFYLVFGFFGFLFCFVCFGLGFFCLVGFVWFGVFGGFFFGFFSLFVWFFVCFCFVLVGSFIIIIVVEKNQDVW